MKEIALEVNDLCVDYIPYQKISIQKEWMKRKNKKKEPVHALKHINFSLQKGEILGIIGKNGSGKSTLLRTIGGIFLPDRGTVDLKGNTVSLLSIGVGFLPELSGRDNIFLSAMLLGFTQEQIKQKITEIIEFSELKEFIDYPVRTYSSGMYSRLAFSITAMLETDIILIDEILSVGDEHFKKKSYKKMRELIDSKNKTVLIVSHNMETIKTLCSQVIWINEGEYQMMGETKYVIREYKKYMNR